MQSHPRNVRYLQSQHMKNGFYGVNSLYKTKGPSLQRANAGELSWLHSPIEVHGLNQKSQQAWNYHYEGFHASALSFVRLTCISAKKTKKHGMYKPMLNFDG